VEPTPCGQISNPKVFCYNFKTVHKFYQIWHVAAAVNAEQCVCQNYPLHLACNVTRSTTV